MNEESKSEVSLVRDKMKLPRKRRRGWKIAVISLVMTVAVPLSVYCFKAYRYWAHPPQLKRNILAELNAPVLVTPDEERAWPLYREAMRGIGRPPRVTAQQGPGSIVIPGVPPPEIDVRPEGYHPTSPEWSVVADFVRNKQPELEQARAAAARPHLGYVWSFAPWPEDREALGISSMRTPEDNPLYIKILLVATQELEKLSRYLVADVYVALEDEDGGRATADIQGLVSISEHLRSPILVSEQFSILIYRRALFALCEGLQSKSHAFSSEQLTALSKCLIAYRNGEILLNVTGAKQTFDDLVQRVYTDDGRGDGNFLPTAMVELEDGRQCSWLDKLVAPLASRKVASRAELVRTLDEVIEMSRSDFSRPLWEYSDPQSLAKLKSIDADRRFFLLSTMFPALEPLYFLMEDTIGRRDATLTAIALVQYEKRHGAWPADLTELVPAFLAAQPVDRFDGQRLRYSQGDETLVLYSVGPDRRDDEGQPLDYGGVIPEPAEWLSKSFKQKLAKGEGDLWLWAMDKNSAAPKELGR